MEIKCEHLYTISENLIDGLNSNVYEGFVLSIMNLSKSVFPNKYSQVESQSHGECDFIDIITGEKFDAKLPFEKKQVRLLTKGKAHKPEWLKWIQEMIAETAEYDPMGIHNGISDIKSTRLYNIMKNQIAKDKEDENIIFFFPFLIGLSYPDSTFSRFATDFLSVIFRQLEREIDFSERSLFAIYPSSLKSIYTLRNLKKQDPEFVTNHLFDQYLTHEIISLE